MDQLFALHTLSADHIVVFPSAARTRVLGTPQEVKGAAIAGPVRTLGRQLNRVVGLLIRVTAKADDSGATAWASHGWSGRRGDS